MSHHRAQMHPFVLVLFVSFFLFIVIFGCNSSASAAPEERCVGIAGGYCVSKFQDGKVTCYSAHGYHEVALSCVVVPQ